MNSDAEKPPENRLLGIAMIVTATALFTVGDVASKLVLATLPPIEVNWMRNVVVACLTLPFAWWRRGPRFLATDHPGAQLFRGGAVLVSSIAFLFGLARLPLADCVAINFVSPMLMTVFAVVLLREQVGPRRWAATLVGFIGALVILRPGTSAFQPAAIWPLLAATFWSLASVVTRRMAATERPETTLSWSVLVALVGTTPMALWDRDWQWPERTEVALILVVGCVSAVSHTLIVLAFERAGPSLLGPFLYGQIVLATALGWFFFGTVPDSWTFSGSALIIASGIYLAHRERARARGMRAGR